MTDPTGFNSFQCVPAGIVCLCVFTLPESPRWLMARGRSEEARAFLVKYHGAGDPNAASVNVQFREFQENIELDGTECVSSRSFQTSL